MEACDILEGLRTTRDGMAPTTVPRACDCPREQGPVHKLERLSGVVGCTTHDNDHAARFLIRRSRGRVIEIEDRQSAHAPNGATRHLGFTIARATIETEGHCPACAATHRGTHA